MSTRFQLKNGQVLISTESPGGVYNALQLKKIAEFCERGSAIVKASEDQRLAIFIDPAKIDEVSKSLKSVGLGMRDYQAGLHQPTSCVGALCPDHEQDALSLSMELGEKLRGIQLASPLKIGVNGCARCCVPCQTLDISLIGETAGYRVSLGGKNSQLPEMAVYAAENVPAEALPELLHKVIEVYKTNAQENESLKDVMDRCGVSDFLTALAPYSQDAGGGSADFGAPEAPAASPATSETAEVEDPVASNAPATTDEEFALEEFPAEEVVAAPETSEEVSALEPEMIGEDITPSADPVEAIEPMSEVAAEALSEEPAIAPQEAIAEVDDMAVAAQVDAALDDPSIDINPTMISPDTTSAPADGEVLIDEPVVGISATDDVIAIEEDPVDSAAETLAPAPTQAPAAVAAAPAADEISLLDTSPEAIAVDEVNEEAALKLEAELEESAATQAAIDSRADENSEDRLEAMKLMEEASVTPQAAAPAEDFEDISYDLGAPELKEATADDDQVTLLDDPVPSSASIAPIRPANTSSKRMEFCGMRLTDDGHLALEFSSGAEMKLDLSSIDLSSGEKTLHMGQSTITLRQSEKGWHILADSIEMTLPSAA